MTTPIVVAIKHRKSRNIGLFFAIFGVLWSMIFLTILTNDPEITMEFICGLIVGPATILCAVFYLGIAIRKPAALRMDAHGISGFYADPAAWGEIAEIKVINGSKGHKFLGFALLDPIAFRDRQTPWRRFTSWANGRHNGAHIVVPDIILEGVAVHDLADQATAFHTAAIRERHVDTTM